MANCRFDILTACLLFLLLCFVPDPLYPEISKKRNWDGDPSTVIEYHCGQVMVLLMGMETCNGTAAAMEVLKEYAANKPRNVSIVRIDIAPPIGEFKPADKKSMPFEYGIDDKRILADKLNFFYYPTLYIFGPEGELRYSGGCDKSSLISMVSEILAEKSGDEKHVYIAKMLEVGKKAPTFSGTTLDGKETTLRKLQGKKATALIFARTKCRFTMAAFAGMKELHDTFKDEGISVVIINRGEAPEVIKPIYSERAPGVVVIHDKMGEITKSYAVAAVPFIYILNKEGNITARMPYAKKAAENSIRQALGMAVESATNPVQGGG